MTEPGAAASPCEAFQATVPCYPQQVALRVPGWAAICGALGPASITIIERLSGAQAASATCTASKARVLT